MAATLDLQEAAQNTAATSVSSRWDATQKADNKRFLDSYSRRVAAGDQFVSAADRKRFQELAKKFG